jgi:hypothetical protein
MHQKSRRGELTDMEIDTDSLNELQNLTEMELRKYALPSNYPYELLAFTASSLVMSFAVVAHRHGVPNLLCTVGLREPKTNEVILHCRIDQGRDGAELREHYAPLLARPAGAVSSSQADLLVPPGA